eukprot:Sdes_comp20008_c0_seq2m12688
MEQGTFDAVFFLLIVLLFCFSFNFFLSSMARNTVASKSKAVPSVDSSLKQVKSETGKQKRPLTAYMHYGQDMRKTASLSSKKVTILEIAESWKKLGTEGKQKYILLAKKDKEAAINRKLEKRTGSGSSAD